MSAFGLYGEVELDSDTTLTNADAVRAVIDRDNGTITNGYLFRGSYEGTQPTNAFGVYISSDVRNYFAGDITIGNTSTDITGVNVQKAGAQIAINDTNGNPKLRFRQNGTTKSLIQTSSGSLTISSGGTTTALTLDTSQNATFAGQINSGAVTSTGSMQSVGSMTVVANGTNDTAIEVGASTAQNHNAYLDLKGDTTYTDYGLRLIRSNGGANTSSILSHRGTGSLFIEAKDAGSVILKTNGSDALTIDNSQNAVFGGVVGIGGTSTSSSYGIWLQNNKWYATQYSSSHDVVRMNANTAGQLDIYNQTDSAFAVIRTGGVNIGSTQVIDSSRNLTNIAGISTAAGAVMGHGFVDGSRGFNFESGSSGSVATIRFDSDTMRFWSGGAGGGNERIRINDAATDNGDINFYGAIDLEGVQLRVSGTTVIDGSRNLTNIASLNMNTGSAVAVPKTFNIANTGSNSGRYIKFGTISSISQEGRSVKITVTSNSGYNAADSQNQETIIRFKTSNGSSNQSGFYGDCQKYDFGNATGSPSVVFS